MVKIQRRSVKQDGETELGYPEPTEMLGRHGAPVTPASEGGTAVPKAHTKLQIPYAHT